MLWAEVTLTNRIDDFGAGDVRVEFNDISREVAAADALAEERSLFKLLTETLPVGVAKFDAVGPDRILERPARTSCSGSIRRRRPPDGSAAAKFRCWPTRSRSCFAKASPHQFTSRERTPPTLDRDLEWTLRPVTSDLRERSPVECCASPMSPKPPRLRAALEAAATTDALTGCLNWAGTINCLQAALRSASPGAGIGLLFIDLNGFKGINDSHGHAIGDRVLELVAGGCAIRRAPTRQDRPARRRRVRGDRARSRLARGHERAGRASVGRRSTALRRASPSCES
jgi:hypothetical protein